MLPSGNLIVYMLAVYVCFRVWQCALGSMPMLHFDSRPQCLMPYAGAMRCGAMLLSTLLEVDEASAFHAGAVMHLRGRTRPR